MPDLRLVDGSVQLAEDLGGLVILVAHAAEPFLLIGLEGLRLGVEVDLALFEEPSRGRGREEVGTEAGVAHLVEGT